MAIKKTKSSKQFKAKLAKAIAAMKARRAAAAKPALTAGVTRATASRVLANGVGATPQKAFGASSKTFSLAGWDAKLPHHIPLPRSVGPYTPIRATRRVNISSRCNVIGTFMLSDGDWNETIMVSDVAGGSNINAPNNAANTTLSLDGLGDAASVVPSALSVQVMCPTSLQTASGIVYMGVMNTQALIAGRAETWDSWCEKFVQFQNPRLLAASRLALRGVQINSYPLNMTECSKFTPLARDSDTTYTFGATASQPTGWAPIVIYNPNSVDLELLITCEFRVRFDLDHPASASHTHHGVSSDSQWDSLVRKAVSLGHGVRDIAEVVADVGTVVQGLRALAL